MMWLQLKPIGPATYTVTGSSGNPKAGWVQVKRETDWPVERSLYNPAYWNNDLSLRLSVILIHHNEVDALRRCLQAICGQTMDKEDYEVIVADDGTMGPAGARLREAVCEFSHRMNVRLVVNPRKDPAETRNCATVSNVGFAAAIGKTILRMSAHIVPATASVLLEQCAIHEAIGHGRLKGRLASLPAGLSQKVMEGADPEPFYDLMMKQQRAPAMIFLKDVLRVGGMSQCFPGWGGEDDLFYLFLDRAGVGVSEIMGGLKYIHLWHRPRTNSQGLFSYNLYQQIRRLPGFHAIHEIPKGVDPRRLDPEVDPRMFPGSDLSRFTLCKP